jgi:hypothetical protein
MGSILSDTVRARKASSVTAVESLHAKGTFLLESSSPESVTQSSDLGEARRGGVIRAVVASDQAVSTAYSLIG